MNKYLIIGLFALAALLGGLYLKTDRDRLTRELNTSTEKVSRLEAEALSAHETLVARDELDRKYFEELTHAKNENEKLRADIATGARRLLVRASCPKQLPALAGTTSVDDATRPELTADARQDYLRLRDQIITTESQLTGLQEYVRQVVQVKK